MLWVNEHQRAWRVAILVLALIALVGPWSFERINVPAEFPCDGSAFIRLEGDYCGTPLSILWVLWVLVINIV